MAGTAGRLARRFELGAEPGDRVAVVGPNCHLYVELYQAVPGGGMVLVPLNQRHAEAELRYALEDSGAKVLFAGRDIGDLPTCVEHVIDLDAGYEALLAAAPPVELDAGDEDALAGLFYTGGTTGASKGVMLTHRNLISNAFHFGMVWPFTPDTTPWMTAPSYCDGLRIVMV